jgi:hypothetical protein
MKQFLKKLGVLTLIVMGIHSFLSLAIPAEWIYARVGMQHKVFRNELLPGWFYPNKHELGASRGDLAQRGGYAVIKPNQAWFLDSLGFRNRYFKKDAPIYIIGESFVFGASLSQEDMVSERLEKSSSIDVYNLATANFRDFKLILDQGLVSQPQLLIYLSLERLITLYPQNERLELHPYLKSKKVLYPTMEVIDRLLKLDYLHKIGADLSQKADLGVAGKYENYRFLSGSEVLKHHDYSNAQASAMCIKRIDDECKKMGIQFVFVSVPNKETAAYQLVPLTESPDYLDRLAFQLDSLQVPNLNGKKIFEKHPKPSELYHADDSHWNAEGAKLMTDTVLKYLKAHHYLPDTK